MRYHNQFNAYRLNIMELFNCLQQGKRWIEFTFQGGRNIITRVDSMEGDYVTGYILHKNVTVTCNEQIIQPSQQAQNCLNKWVKITIPNNNVLDFYLTHFDNYSIGGSFYQSALLPLMFQQITYQCSTEPPTRKNRQVLQNVGGNYETNYGPLSLVQGPGNNVTGTYVIPNEDGMIYYGGENPSVRGTLQGTISGNVLTGTWQQTDGGSGPFIFTFSPNGNFKGKWNYPFLSPEYEWNGIKKDL